MSELFTTQDITALGIGGFAIVSTIGMLWYFLKTLNPVLSNIKETNSAHAEVIRNNTSAIKEISRSNDNVALALSMIQSTLENNNKLLERHEIATMEVQSEIIKISERTQACLRK